jgi:hypothetical protein
LGLASLFVTPNVKKMDGNGNQAVNDEPFINKRKPLSTTAVKGALSNAPSPKKWMEMVTKLSLTNFSLMKESH